ncbi:S8 family peptidase [Mycobacterium talmoniae]|uniref:Serine peptidase n=2 Tax=Mycobacterium talmoniae TaxID=1858794 RepID=A0A1S1NGY2_9MYCO|nr:serine peptidase [Mycobacterium talmoniae]TDH50145.1 serine peptidase [Mycobacterium eburneum]
MVSRLLLAPANKVPPAAHRAMRSVEQGRRVVLVELRLPPGADPAAVREQFHDLFTRVFRGRNRPPSPVPIGRHYMRCVLATNEVERLVQGGARPSAAATQRALALIYHVWPDFVVDAHLDRSVTTIQADAASRTFRCDGTGVTWAVIDSGINEHHPHFTGTNTLSASSVASLHCDFTITDPASATTGSAPLTDPFGHGTHVAGIIAGQAPADHRLVRIAANEPTAQGLPRWVQRSLPPGATLSGVAPRANLVSLRVLDDSGQTLSSAVIAALDHVRTINGGGRDLVIHGVNLSLGCGWLIRDYAAGQSPLCRELDLLVGTGVVAVVSAGNLGAGVVGAGVGAAADGASGDVYGQLSTITDPGNAALAITVGSVHRYKPHTYGVTFDSSKGPTLDGRLKPDLVAPGERITSAATGQLAAGVPPLATGPGDASDLACYIEDSGTSMAAAHVSGAIAAFLSARTEFIGQPQLVKKIFIDTATDLGRHQFFQGAGLVNLLRALMNT